jgi:aerobic C4-dicarboxylate transport protein
VNWRAFLPRNLTARVLIAVAIGITIGAVAPDAGKALRPLGDTFINLVKMIVAPIVFLTITLGIAQMADVGRVGRIGFKAFIYFTITTVIALAIGIVLVNLLEPGAGLNVVASAASEATAAQYTDQADSVNWITALTGMVPPSIIGAFAKGDILQVVFFSVLFGIALTTMPERAAGIIDLLERLQDVFFKLVGMIMVVAPLGALGAMAYTVGAFGLTALIPLAKLMGTVYLAMALFVFGGLGWLGWMYGVRVVELLRFIRHEIVLVLGTSSSEAALPRLMQRLEDYGCSRPVVGLMVPAGYSFNMDGTALYLVMATIFLAQVSGVDLTLSQQLGVLGVLLVMSNGAAGVTGSGFVVLASTLAAVKVIPLDGLALLLGVDRFMSEARAITNFSGNAIACVAIAKQEGAFDEAKRAAAVAADSAPA